jgi:pyruvate dehydrogenase E2 component (dihydrolipoamide acetyltransferase)
MTVPLKLPELGEHVEFADLIKIMVSVGDRIAVDQPVLELETDKANFELPSSVSGVVREIHVHEGEKIKVGQIVLTVEEESPGASPAPVEKATPVPERAKPAIAPAPPTTQPTEGRSMPAASSELPAPTAPRLLVPASPTVRRLARELGILIEQVPGSGPASRVLAEDVKAFAKRVILGAGAGRPGTMPVLPDFSRWGEIERKEMSGIRRKIAESMSHSWSTIPHVTHFESADITDLEKLRQRIAGEIEAAGGKLTITSILVKIIASALKVFPNFAASVDMERTEIILKKYCHIGVAVDTDRGLIVPVIRDADKKNILQLSVELIHLAEKVRSKKITLEELEGAVITITNLGGIGGTQFSPIIHAPEVAILGISKARQEAVFVDGKFEPRLMLPLALSYDHRLIDGADAARFLRWVVQALEQPFVLPLEG